MSVSRKLVVEAGRREEELGCCRKMMSRCDSKRLLAGLTCEQREAVAVFVETARPWLAPGAAVGARISVEDVAHCLRIVADGIRLQSECDPPGAVPSFTDGSAWIEGMQSVVRNSVDRERCGDGKRGPLPECPP